MRFPHLCVYLASQIAISLDLGQSLDVPADYEG